MIHCQRNTIVNKEMACLEKKIFQNGEYMASKSGDSTQAELVRRF